jgi:UPF0042 nucleotide-binding protein
VLDTTRLTVHDLRREMVKLGGGTTTASPLSVTLLSFAFKRGVPADADLVFDVRFLKNPHFVPTLRPLTGRNSRVAKYVLSEPEAKRFMDLTIAMLKFLLPQYVAEGKTYLTVAIGCTGGRHRSVAIAEALGRALRRTPGVRMRVRHREGNDA